MVDFEPRFEGTIQSLSYVDNNEKYLLEKTAGNGPGLM